MGPTDLGLLPVGFRELPDGRWQLLFPSQPPNLALEVLSLEEVRPLLTAFSTLEHGSGPRLRLLEVPGAEHSSHRPTTDWEARLREEFLSRFGPPLLPLPESLTSSRLFLALQLSTRYMADGIREAAIALFTSPVFVLSVCLSIVVYFSAWLMPEPLFSKAFAATLTLRLALAAGLVEVGQVAMACLRLYREVEASSTPQELEAASARFGKSMGGTYLRVLVTVATLGLTRFIPQVPEGGIWRLFPPATPQGLVLLEQSASGAQVMANGSLIVSGVAMGTASCSGLALCATNASVSAPSGASRLSTRYGPPHTRKNPRHNAAIEDELAAREAAGHTDLRKNKPQVDERGNRLFEQSPTARPAFRRPDVSSIRPDGIRHNINYVSNPKDLKRELDAFEAMKRADLDAIHELYLLDGTLVRRHVPASVQFP
ncbi:hypothetical protein ATI61_12081 [Archangium gephyra]|uniref:Lipoprotein n=1 Tax=Archangium gephyra TaxID=48 RepID=A0ABX9JM64_9BACT|nr:hypothetical protein [Archangium gephyra]REG20725.1 hypothetical protein ATI61_12081 [Archangium gephyra]